MRSGRLAAGLLALALAACAGRLPEKAAPPDEGGVLPDPPQRAGHPTVLVAMPDIESFRAVHRGLVAELKKDFNVVTWVVDARSTANGLAARLDAVHPACLVLMDNPTVRLYRATLAAHRRPPLPVVVVMASFLEDLRGELPSSTGVSYEVPGVTVFVNLRSVVARAVNRVGVVHRPSFRRFVERQKKLAAREEITLVPVEVSAQPGAAEVRAALRSLREGGRIDALWVLNDSGLLKDAEFLESAWRPELPALGVPVVVGVPTLVSAQAQFGDFAVLPDLEAMGAQAAGVLFDISESGWQAGAHPVELPVSTVTAGNLRRLQERFGLRPGAAARIDKVVE